MSRDCPVIFVIAQYAGMRPAVHFFLYFDKDKSLSSDAFRFVQVVFLDDLVREVG